MFQSSDFPVVFLLFRCLAVIDWYVVSATLGLVWHQGFEYLFDLLNTCLSKRSAANGEMLHKNLELPCHYFLNWSANYMLWPFQTFLFTPTKRCKDLHRPSSQTSSLLLAQSRNLILSLNDWVKYASKWCFDKMVILLNTDCQAQKDRSKMPHKSWDFNVNHDNL